jgi:hypothetical protein
MHNAKHVMKFQTDSRNMLVTNYQCREILNQTTYEVNPTLSVRKTWSCPCPRLEDHILGVEIQRHSHLTSELHKSDWSGPLYVWERTSILTE